jgi:BirA family biotin operon repressor/biotin-[acetyl-CoA-carboxylase] ligase
LGLTAQLKWPNDVLLDGKKVAGVLVEADWLSDKAAFVVIGMGVNISPDSIPPIDRLRYPATAVELGLDRPVDRWALLADTLGSIRKYRFDLAEETFIQAWNDALAFRNTWVRFRQPGMDAQIVKVLGVHPDGQLALELESNRRLDVSTGEILMIGEGQSLD